MIEHTEESARIRKPTSHDLLSLDSVTKRFDGFTAVDNVSFSLQAGAITGLIGPNGAGKTTLFNIVSGQLAPDSGAITLDGVPIHGSPMHKIFNHGIARTFQIPRPFAEMTVLENVMTVPAGQYGEGFWNNWLRARKVATQEKLLRGQAMELIDFCGLSAMHGEPAGSLSGGQLKLLELARALMSAPKLILLDEPAAGVNPVLLESLVDRIERLNKDGYSFLIIEHNMDVVMSLCNPIRVMAQGKLIFSGEAIHAQSDPLVLDAYLGGLV